MASSKQVLNVVDHQTRKQRLPSHLAVHKKKN